jgi:hypothetical protein
MYIMYQSVLIHQAEAYRYRPGQEDTTLCILSSADSDAGIYQVIHVPQGDPAAYEGQKVAAWTRLRQAVATLSFAVRQRVTGSQVQAVSADATGLLGEAPR